MRSDEPKIDPDKIEDFSFFYIIVLKPGGFAVILAELSMIHIWTTMLNTAGLKVVPYP